MKEGKKGSRTHDLYREQEMEERIANSGFTNDEVEDLVEQGKPCYHALLQIHSHRPRPIATWRERLYRDEQGVHAFC
jgi:hypothetical protein